LSQSYWHKGASWFFGGAFRDCIGRVPDSSAVEGGSWCPFCPYFWHSEFHFAFMVGIFTLNRFSGTFGLGEIELATWGSSTDSLEWGVMSTALSGLSLGANPEQRDVSTGPLPSKNRYPDYRGQHCFLRHQQFWVGATILLGSREGSTARWAKQEFQTASPPKPIRAFAAPGPKA